MRPGRLILATALAVAASAPAVHAQETPAGLAGLLLRFFSEANPVILREAPPPFSHAAHFLSQPAARESLTALNRSVASQLSTFPLGSSSAGFTYTFDPALGIYNRSTETFGPVFSERPVTAGKGKFSFGINYQRATYDTFEGLDLGEGEIQFNLRHLDVNNDQSTTAPWFEGDIIQANLFLDLESETAVLFANYGLGERFDVGVALPYVRLDMKARIHTGIDRLATGVDPFIIHIFSDGTTQRDFEEKGSAEGLGDIVLRGKFNLVRGATTGLAIGADVRLPTGKEEDLLGSGATQAKLYLVGAWVPTPRFSPRLTAGYTLSSGGASFIGDLPDELNFSAGFDAAVHSRVTLTADVLGRYLRDANRARQTDETLLHTLRTNPTVEEVHLPALQPETGDLTLLVGAAGLKINPFGRLLVVGNVLFSLTDDGLQDKITPVVGLDYSF